MNLSTTCNYVTDRDDMNNKIKIYQDLPARLIVQMNDLFFSFFGTIEIPCATNNTKMIINKDLLA